jgi:acetyl esterase
VVRKVFAAGGANTAGTLGRHAPRGVLVIADERYGPEPDMLLDVYRPASASGPLPLCCGFTGPWAPTAGSYS